MDDPYAEVKVALGNPKPFLVPAVKEALASLDSAKLRALFEKTVAARTDRPTSPWSFGTVVRIKDADTSPRWLIVTSTKAMCLGDTVLGQIINLHPSDYALLEPVPESDD